MERERMPALRVRRLLRQDVAMAAGLYAGLGRDGAWAGSGALEEILRYGELWGGFRTQGLSICGGLCPASAPVPMAMAATATQLLPHGALLVLPPAGSSDDMRRFTEILLARAVQRQDGGVPVALVSVKNGTGFVAGCLGAGLQLAAVRPLVSLRPHYIFLPPDNVQSEAKESIMVSVGDTLRLSRLLEEGFRGVAQWGTEVELCATAQTARR